MEFVIVIISHIVLVGRWFDDDVPNGPAVIEGKISKKKDISSTLI